MYIKKRNCPKGTSCTKRVLSILLSMIVGFSLLFSLSAVYGKEALPPTITLAKYQAVTIGMEKEDLVTLLGGEGTIKADRMIYKGAANDRNAVKEVEISIDSISGLVYQKEIKYALRLLNKKEKERNSYPKEWDVYTYSGKGTKLTVPAYVSETVYLDPGGVEMTEKKSPIIYLYLYKKKLTALSVDKCIELKRLTCERNKLTKLDVTKNKSLWSLTCSYNKLSKMNVTKNTKLEVFNCDNNKLKKLNVTKNKKLQILYCPKNALRKINVSKNKKLDVLNCCNNKIKKLNVTKNKELWDLECSNNKIKKLNVTKNKYLLWLLCSSNSLKKINVKKNKDLIVFHCYKNKIKSLDVSKNKNLQELEVDKRLPKSKLHKWLRNVKPIKYKGHWLYERKKVW